MNQLHAREGKGGNMIKIIKKNCIYELSIHKQSHVKELVLYNKRIMAITLIQDRLIMEIKAAVRK